jgi:hypothetical protein
MTHLYDLTVVVAELRTRSLMGEDYWPYGVRPNLQTIETFVRYHHVQGLSQEPLSQRIFRRKRWNSFRQIAQRERRYETPKTCCFIQVQPL